MAKIGIVTVLYNSESVLDDFFISLNNQTEKDFVLYIVDNKSPDSSLALSYQLAKKYEDSFLTCIIENEKNDGVARGNNLGIELALKDGCQYILLSNNDVVLEHNTLEALLKGHNQKKADLSVPKIYYFGTNLIWAAGGKFSRVLGDTNHFGCKEEDLGQYNENRKVEYAPTCFMLINRDVFEQIGIMDERYFVYYDDTDFVYRATQTKGLSLYYIADSLVHHKESVSTGVMSYFTVFHCNRNMLYFTLKNRGLFWLFWIVTVRFIIMITRHSFTYNKQCRKAERDGLIAGLKMCFNN